MTANNKDLFTGRQVMVNEDFEFYHFENREPVAVGYHDHDFYEVFLFLSGNVDYIIEGRTYSLRPGDILLTGVQELHKPVIRPGRLYERYVIWMQQGFIQQLSSESTNLAACFEDATDRHYRLIRPDGDLQRKMQQHFVRLSQAYSQADYGSDLLARAYLIELLVNLNRAYFDTSNQIMLDVIENEKINQIVEHINQNLGDDLSLDELSEMFYLSKYHLGRQFKKYTGFSPYQFIIKKRLINARMLISQGVKATQACHQSGFTDYSNFLKAYRREFNHLPKQKLI